MDAARTLARWRELSAEQWLAAGNRVLPPVVTAVLVIAIAYELAGLTWALVPSGAPVRPAPEIAAPPAEAGAAADRGSRYEALRAAHLFGEPPAQSEPAPAERVVDAPDTTLSLELTGIVAHSSGSERGQAIIASGRDRQRVYSVGDTIDGANGARLHAVYYDRVILNRGGGQLEALRLPKELAARTGRGQRTAAMPRPAPPRPNDGSLREVISDNASRITDVIRPAPQIEGGEVVGFRVNPGRNREAFDALGLEPGDVVTDVNGTPLNDASAGLRLFEALGEATMANVTVLRDGTPQVLVVDTSQIERLAENMQ